jgi:hypothetical protein
MYFIDNQDLRCLYGNRASEILTSLSFHPDLNTTRNLLITNHLAHIAYHWHSVCLVIAVDLCT